MSITVASARHSACRETPPRVVRLEAPPTSGRSQLTEEELCTWLGTAFPGDVIEYHRGNLAEDRSADRSKLTDADRRRLIAVAGRALNFAAEGRAHLVQRRHGDGDYSYLAVKTARRPLPVDVTARRARR